MANEIKISSIKEIWGHKICFKMSDGSEKCFTRRDMSEKGEGKGKIFGMSADMDGNAFMYQTLDDDFSEAGVEKLFQEAMSTRKYGSSIDELIVKLRSVLYDLSTQMTNEKFLTLCEEIKSEAALECKGS